MKDKNYSNIDSYLVTKELEELMVKCKASATNKKDIEKNGK